MYPPALKSPYGERRAVFGKERYSAPVVAREDWRHIDRVEGSRGEVHTYGPGFTRPDGHVRGGLKLSPRTTGD